MVSLALWLGGQRIGRQCLDRKDGSAPQWKAPVNCRGSCFPAVAPACHMACRTRSKRRSNCELGYKRWRPLCQITRRIQTLSSSYVATVTSVCSVGIISGIFFLSFVVGRDRICIAFSSEPIHETRFNRCGNAALGVRIRRV